MASASSPSPGPAHALATSHTLLVTPAQVKKKMSLESFMHNNRGINDNEDFPPEFLEELYNNIACKAFRIPLAASDGSTTTSPRPSRASRTTSRLSIKRSTTSRPSRAKILHKWV